MLTFPWYYEQAPSKLNWWNKYKDILLQKSEYTDSKLIIRERIINCRGKTSGNLALVKFDPDFKWRKSGRNFQQDIKSVFTQ